MPTNTKTKKNKRKSKHLTSKGGAFFQKFFSVNPLQAFIDKFDTRLRKNKYLLHIMANINNIKIHDYLQHDIPDLLNDLKMSKEDTRLQLFLILYLLMFILYVRIHEGTSTELQGTFYEEYPIWEHSLDYENDENMKSLNLKLEKLRQKSETSSCAGCFDRAHFILIGQGIMDLSVKIEKFSTSLNNEMNKLKEMDKDNVFMTMFEKTPDPVNPQVVEDSGISENTRTDEEKAKEKAMDEAEKAMDEAMKGADSYHRDKAIEKWLKFIDSNEKYEKEYNKYEKKVKEYNEILKLYSDRLQHRESTHTYSAEDYEEIKVFKKEIEILNQRKNSTLFILKKLQKNKYKNIELNQTK